MKNLRLTVRILLAAAVCVSCTGRGADSAKGVVTVDISSRHPAEEIRLQTIADVEYVALAISDEVLLAPSDRLFYLSDSYIMVSGRHVGIVVFDRAGRIVSRFNHSGRGPGEYVAVRDIVFDERAGEFFVVDSASPKIEVYSLAGNHLRTLTLPEDWQVRIYNFDEGSLLAYDEGGLYNDNYSTAPYSLLSKADGNVWENIDINLPVRYSTMHIRTETGENGRVNVRPLVLSHTNNRRGGNEFLLADISSDTVYHFTRNRALIPTFVRKPSVNASEPTVIWGMEIIADDFVVFEILTLDFESAWSGTYPPQRRIKYDYATEHTSEVTFIDDSNPSVPWSNHMKDKAELPGNTAAQLLDPLKLKEALEKDELAGPLAELAAGLNEDDNPVVMIVRFRQSRI